MRHSRSALYRAENIRDQLFVWNFFFMNNGRHRTTALYRFPRSIGPRCNGAAVYFKTVFRLFTSESKSTYFIVHMLVHIFLTIVQVNRKYPEQTNQNYAVWFCLFCSHYFRNVYITVQTLAKMQSKQGLQCLHLHLALFLHNPIHKPSIVNSQYLKVKVHTKLLIPQSKFSGSRKFILRYQYFLIIAVET